MPVKTVIEPPIGWIVFNRPEVRNAFNVEMWHLTAEAALELDRNEEVKVIIMRGEGHVFGAGADIRELLEYAETNRAQLYAEAVNYCFRNLAEVQKIMIAAIEGYALGGGCMVALSCDLRVCEEDAKVGIPLVKLGLAVEPLGIKRLIETAGVGFAAEFLLTGDPIPAEKLTASGIINFLVKRGEAVNFSRNLALKILENGYFSLLMTKKIMKEWLSGNPDYTLLNRAFASCMERDEFKERARRFIRKS